MYQEGVQRRYRFVFIFNIEFTTACRGYETELILKGAVQNLCLLLVEKLKKSVTAIWLHDLHVPLADF